MVHRRARLRRGPPRAGSRGCRPSTGSPSCSAACRMRSTRTGTRRRRGGTRGPPRPPRGAPAHPCGGASRTEGAAGDDGRGRRVPPFPRGRHRARRATSTCWSASWAPTSGRWAPRSSPLERRPAPSSSRTSPARRPQRGAAAGEKRSPVCPPQPTAGKHADRRLGRVVARRLEQAHANVLAAGRELRPATRRRRGARPAQGRPQAPRSARVLRRARAPTGEPVRQAPEGRSRACSAATRTSWCSSS